MLIAATQQFVIRYFGYGNETSFDKNLEKENYYKANQNLLTFFPTLHYNFSKKIIGSLGISFIQTKTSLNNDTLLTGFRYGDYGLGVIKPFGIHLGLEIDGKDHPAVSFKWLLDELSMAKYFLMYTIYQKHFILLVLT